MLPFQSRFNSIFLVFFFKSYFNDGKLLFWQARWAPINFHSSMKLHRQSLRLQFLPLIENGVFSNKRESSVSYYTETYTGVPTNQNLSFEPTEKKTHRESMFTFLPAPTSVKIQSLANMSSWQWELLWYIYEVCTVNKPLLDYILVGFAIFLWQKLVKFPYADKAAYLRMTKNCLNMKSKEIRSKPSVKTRAIMKFDLLALKICHHFNKNMLQNKLYWWSIKYVAVGRHGDSFFNLTTLLNPTRPSR